MTRVSKIVSLVLAWTAAGGCTLVSGVDDLEGGDRTDASTGSGGGGGVSGASGDGGSGATCSVDNGCVGCASCNEFCACSKPFAIAACMATECPDAGTGGSAGSSDAGSDGDAGGTGGSANCSDTSYVSKSCAVINVSAPCAACMTASCCKELEACFASESCARTYACWETHCSNTPDPTTCITQKCPCFSEDSQLIINVGTCSSNLCAAECSSG